MILSLSLTGTNPHWNSSMQFLIKDLHQDILCLTVFDRDLFSPDGELTIFCFDLLKIFSRVRIPREDGDSCERDPRRLRGEAGPGNEDTQAAGGRVWRHHNQA